MKSDRMMSDTACNGCRGPSHLIAPLTKHVVQQEGENLAIKFTRGTIASALVSYCRLTTAYVHDPCRPCESFRFPFISLRPLPKYGY